MRMAALVCCIHIWWGSSMVFGIPLPRPFGAIEPFFMFSDYPMAVGIILLVSGLLPLTPIFWPRKLWCISCLMIPQQTILCWGFVAGVTDVVVLHDGRAWYALGYTGMFFIFHGWDLCDKFIIEIIRRKQAVDKKSSDDNG